MITTREFKAGIFEQSDDGWRRVEWSTHKNADLARRAARKYRKRLFENDGPQAGGLYSWASWVSGPGVDEVYGVECQSA